MKKIDEQYTRAEILLFPDERLQRRSAPVVSLDDETIKEALLLERMLEDMETLGFSAPQINIHKRLFVLRRNGKIFHLINPEISWTQGMQVFYEGCSSFPGKVFKTERSAEIVIVATDLEGKEISFLLEGDLSRVAQHQMDHLNGILVNIRGELLSQEAA